MPYVEKLKAIRDAKGLTNVEISKLSETPLATITRVFNGSTPNPTFETISRIALAMGVSLDELIGLKQPDEQPITSPVENTLNLYSELLKGKDDRINELKDEVTKVRKEKCRAIGISAIFALCVLVILAIDIANHDFGYFRY